MNTINLCLYIRHGKFIGVSSNALTGRNSVVSPSKTANRQKDTHKSQIATSLHKFIHNVVLEKLFYLYNQIQSVIFHKLLFFTWANLVSNSIAIMKFIGDYGNASKIDN